MEALSALLALCVGNSTATGEFPSQRSVTRSFHVFFDLRLNDYDVTVIYCVCYLLTQFDSFQWASFGNSNSPLDSVINV